MKEKPDYARDLTEIRSMMERSSKFLSLSGMAGIMAGVYALVGTYVSYRVFDFNPAEITSTDVPSGSLGRVVLLAIIVLVLSVSTAILLSWKNAKKRQEKFWNATTRRVVGTMAVPLVAGGLLILVFISKGLLGLIAPSSLIFYGLALFGVSKFTYQEMRFMGLIEIVLGLIGAYFVEYALICWALGFGLVHIIYGIYLHYKYER